VVCRLTNSPSRCTAIRALLSAWSVQRGYNRLCIYLAPTWNEALSSKALEELKCLRDMHDLILDAAGEGTYGLDRKGNTTYDGTAVLVSKPRVNLTRFARIIPDTHPLRWSAKAVTAYLPQTANTAPWSPRPIEARTTRRPYRRRSRRPHTCPTKASG
jgi:hypothetical protein